MPFAEGNQYGQGRPEGSKNLKTQRWDRFAEFLMEEGLDKFERELTKLEGKEYIKVIIDMMEYFRPKLRRTESTIEHTTQLPIPIMDVLSKPVLDYLDEGERSFKQDNRAQVA